MRFLAELKKRFTDWRLSHRVVWSGRSYVGFWKDSRCWCPVWARKDAAGRVYLPTPAGWDPGSKDSAPSEMAELEQRLSATGVRPVWIWNYNQGANPIGITLSLADLDKPEVKELFDSTWKAL